MTITTGFTNPVMFIRGKRKGQIGFIIGKLDKKRIAGVTKEWVKIPRKDGRGFDLDVFAISSLAEPSKAHELSQGKLL